MNNLEHAFAVIQGAMDHSVLKGAYTIDELKQIIPALDVLKEHFAGIQTAKPKPAKK